MVYVVAIAAGVVLAILWVVAVGRDTNHDRRDLFGDDE